MVHRKQTLSLLSFMIFYNTLYKKLTIIYVCLAWSVTEWLLRNVFVCLPSSECMLYTYEYVFMYFLIIL